MRKIKNFWFYLLGNIRFYVTEKNFPTFIQKIVVPYHIKIQQEIRMKYDVKEECRENGRCIECGCNVEKMTYTNKICESECYDKFLNKEKLCKAFYNELEDKLC